MRLWMRPYLTQIGSKEQCNYDDRPIWFSNDSTMVSRSLAQSPKGSLQEREDSQMNDKQI